jgi:NHL repeat
LTHVISADGDGDVVGVTSVDDRLFVLRSPSQQSIQVYDLKTFAPQQHKLKVKGLSDHSYNRLTKCVVNKCLYVSDCQNSTVYEVQLTVDHKTSKWLVGCRPYNLSINTACNLLVACFDDSKIEEYTTGGSLVREIFLNSDDGKSLNPLHVIQLTSGQFIVSCYDDVVELDANGQVLVSYTNQLQSATQQNFSWPFHLTVDENNGCILVADNYNHRVVILSRSFNFCARELKMVSVDSGLQYPSCLHFNESQDRLFVGEGRGHRRILVFDNISNSFQ